MSLPWKTTDERWQCFHLPLSFLVLQQISSLYVVVVFFALDDIECDPARLLLCRVEHDKNAR